MILSTPINDFTQALSLTLDKVTNKTKCYMFGDTNIDLSQTCNDKNTANFVDSILDAHFLPYVYLPTRITNHSATIIDHMYCNDIFDSNCTCKLGLAINDISDHLANFAFIINKSNQSKKNSASCTC